MRKIAQVLHYNMSYLPGFATLYEAIFQLPANCALGLASNQIRRIFPRAAKQAASLESVVSRCAILFRRTVEKFCAKYKAVASITAGLDTRLTLAASRTSLKKLDYFCYTRTQEPINYVDVVMANKLGAQFGFHVQNIIFNYEQPPNDSQYAQFFEMQKHNNEFEHFYPLSYAYLTQLPSYDLHFRSNIGEALRAYYYKGGMKRIAYSDASLLDKLVQIYCTETRSEPHPFGYEQFERYCQKTALQTHHFGYDELILYELEHGISVWQSSVLRESDAAFDTVCIFNCREIIRLFMSLDFNQWVNAEGMLGCIKTLWPELLTVPLNPAFADLPDTEYAEYPVIDLNFVKQKTRIKVTAHIADNQIIAQCVVRDEFTQGNNLEFAYYVYTNGQRFDTVWYQPSSNFQYQLKEDMKGKDISVRAFVRYLENHEIKASSMSSALLYQ